MKYVVLVSHGEFAKGLANALSMLAGEKKEVIAVGLEMVKLLMNSQKYLRKQ